MSKRKINRHQSLHPARAGNPMVFGLPRAESPESQ